MKTAFPGIDVSVVYAFLLFTMKSAIMFSAILSLCRFGDHALTFSRLHGNDSGGSVGLRFSDFLRLFLLFLFIHSFIHLFILFHFILFYFLFISCYVILFLFIYFFIRTTHPKSGNAFDAKWKRKTGVALLPLSMRGIFLVAIYVFNSAVSWCEAWN